MIAVRMPYAERRDYAIIRNIWPEIDAVMASPHVPFHKYHERGFQGRMSRHDIISDMVGDFQRMMIYPGKQEDGVPSGVLDAYHGLVERGYTEHMLRDDCGEMIGI